MYASLTHDTRGAACRRGTPCPGSRSRCSPRSPSASAARSCGRCSSPAGAPPPRCWPAAPAPCSCCSSRRSCCSAAELGRASAQLAHAARLRRLRGGRDPAALLLRDHADAGRRGAADRVPRARAARRLDLAADASTPRRPRARRLGGRHRRPAARRRPRWRRCRSRRADPRADCRDRRRGLLRDQRPPRPRAAPDRAARRLDGDRLRRAGAARRGRHHAAHVLVRRASCSRARSCPGGCRPASWC